MHVRRSRPWAALALALALGGLSAPTSAADAGADRAAAPTTGRFITTTKQGVVLVDEDGKHQDTVIRAKKAVVADMPPKSGTFIWASRSSGATKWHITNLFGADLGSFRVPA